MNVHPSVQTLGEEEGTFELTRAAEKIAIFSWRDLRKENTSMLLLFQQTITELI